MIAVLALGLLDVWRASERVPEPPAAWVLPAAWAVSAGAALSLAGTFFLLRRALTRRLPLRSRAAVTGFCDGLAFGCLGLVLEDIASVSVPLRMAAAVALGLGAALLASAPRFPPWVWWLGSALALLGAEWLPAREKPWLRLVLDTFAIGAFAVAFAAGNERRSPAEESAPSAGMPFGNRLLLGALVLAPIVLLRLPAVRGFSYEYAAHTLAFLPHGLDPSRRISAWLDRQAADTPRPRLGNVRCSELSDGERQGPEPYRPSPLSGSARGADVLLLSFDALRWDHADAIPLVWQELEPAVHFGRAVTPAPRTVNSFAALLRGVPSRALSESQRSRAGGSQAPTLAEVLVRHGYRAVQVPTHRYFGRGRPVNTGFELVFTEGFADTRKKQGKAYPIVRAEVALAAALEVASHTVQPLLLWVHLMEGHEPYRWRGGQGPATPDGQRHAYSDLDPIAAQFLRDFRLARQGRPAVIAVFGDHGEEFGEHGGKFHSTSVYSEQVRAALALHAPGVSSGWIQSPVAHASLPATVVDWLGLPPVASFSEPSLLGCMAEPARCPDLAVSQLIARGRSIGYTFERHRLLVDPEHDTVRLFDSGSDPLERRDLAAREPALLAKLSERARRFDRENCLPDTADERNIRPTADPESRR